MQFPWNALIAWVVINIIPLFVTVLCCVGEDNVIFVPIWRAVWGVIPFNFIGKMITCIACGITFLPADICFFILIVAIRGLRHVGYAWWWLFAINRADVIHRWRKFWGDKDLYFGYWDSFDTNICNVEWED